MKTIALVDWNWIGHHPTYFRNLVDGFAKAGCRVAAFCPPQALEEISVQAVGLPQVTVSVFRKQHERKRLPAPLRVRDHARRFFGGLEKSLRYWEREHGGRIDLVFFATIYDFEFETIGYSSLWFSRPWSGIYLHARAFRMPGTPTPYQNKLPCPETIFTHPTLSSVCLIDEGAVEPMQKLTRGRPAIAFPDITGTVVEQPWDGDTLSGKLLRFAASRKIVVCLGHLQRTKGLLELCRAANEPRCRDLCVFFGGEVNWNELEPDEVRFIQQTWEQNPNVMTHLCRLSDETMNSLIKASDVVFAAYTNFPNSSNIMTKAALLEKPIIVSDGHLMAERVRKYHLGDVVPEGSVEDIVESMMSLTRTGGDHRADYIGYYSKHSTAALMTAINKVVAANPIWHER